MTWFVRYRKELDVNRLGAQMQKKKRARYRAIEYNVCKLNASTELQSIVFIKINGAKGLII